MKFRLFVVLSLLVCLLGFSFSYAADQKPSQEEMAAMMKKWTDFATPGAAHKAMASLVGTWDATVKSLDPSMPQESKGTAVYTSLMDGRYVQETVESTFNGMPFHGMGTYAYDNLMKKYYGTWIDNMGTGIMTMEGTSPDGGKTINWSGKGSDPMSGKQQAYRSVMKTVTPDQLQFEMFGPGPDGKEMKMMEMTYNRKK